MALVPITANQIVENIGRVVVLQVFSRKAANADELEPTSLKKTIGRLDGVQFERGKAVFRISGLIDVIHSTHYYELFLHEPKVRESDVR